MRVKLWPTVWSTRKVNEGWHLSKWFQSTGGDTQANMKSGDGGALDHSHHFGYSWQLEERERERWNTCCRFNHAKGGFLFLRNRKALQNPSDPWRPTIVPPKGKQIPSAGYRRYTCSHQMKTGLRYHWCHKKLFMRVKSGEGTKIVIPSLSQFQGPSCKRARHHWEFPRHCWEVCHTQKWKRDGNARRPRATRRRGKEIACDGPSV